MPYLDIEKQRKAQREYYERNKLICQERTKKWRENNPKRDKEHKATYIKNDPERRKEQTRISVAKFRKKNLEHCRKQNRQYKRDNPDIIQSAKAIRRIKKWGSYKLLSKEEKAMCRSFYTEAKEKNKHSKIKYVVDHIIPISKGGKHNPQNLQVVPELWNMQKGSNLWGAYKGE
jgi:5-methylcytosine-specific restriction endonuclease McrA|tara:strand:- start:19 stop:540 length:522 start_codon:yes stop_codon:yes gene_type:complete